MSVFWVFEGEGPHVKMVFVRLFSVPLLRERTTHPQVTKTSYRHIYLLFKLFRVSVRINRCTHP